MVAAGLLDTSVEHAQATANMAFGMMKESVKVLEPVTLVPLQVGTYTCGQSPAETTSCA